MKNNYKKHIKTIFTFFILFCAFFGRLWNLKAETALTCVYTDSSGDSEIRIKVNTNGKLTEYDYVKWNGSKKSEIESTSFADDYWEDGYWDITAYEKRPSKDEACPPYIWGSYSGILTDGSGIYSHSIPYFVNSSTYTSGSSKKYIYKHEKVLSYNPDKSSYDALMKNPRPVGTLVFKQGTSTTYSDDEARPADFKMTSITTESDKKYLIYIKGSNKTFGEAAHLSKGAIECSTTDTTGAIKNISNVSILNIQNTLYNPIAYFTFETGTPTKGTAATITCNYQKNNDGQTVSSSGSFNITVNNSNTNKTYTEQDLKCEYISTVDGTEFVPFQVEIKNWNDGYNDGYKEENVIFRYKNASGSWDTVQDVSKKITACQNCTSNKGIYVTLTKSQFFSALVKKNGDCPVLYAAKDTVIGHGGHYKFTTDTYTGERMQRYIRYTKKTNGSYVANYYNEDKTQQCARDVSFNIAGKDVTTTITFLKNGNEFFYKVSGMGETETSITSNITSKNDLDIKVASAITKSTGNNYTHDYYEVYYVSIQYDYLKKIYDNMDPCYNVAPITNITGPTQTEKDTGAGKAHYTNYFINWATTAEELPDEGTEGNENKDVEVGGVVQGTGVETAQGGRTDELNLTAGDNNGDMTCDDFFGPEGSRNSLYDVLHTLITAIRIGTPILLILLTMIDFTKATANDEALPKAKKQAVTRAIVAVVIFMLPSLVNLVLLLIGMESCMIN